MQCDRRAFLGWVGSISAAGAGLGPLQSASASGTTANGDDAMGVLVDLTQCVGCRLCEYACREANGFETGPLESYDDTSVFAEFRRPTPDQHTVVNAFEVSGGERIYAKANCMHCNHPACASACIVGALKKQPDGTVSYDAWKCIGCRYCMVACPFQVPTYEYNDPLTPKVQKCNFCADRRSKGERPACVDACPREALTYGKRSELIDLAHERIAANPDEYIDHVYGEHEVGGTSWLYLSPVSFDKVGMLDVDASAPPKLTEAIQHGVFKHWIAPVGLYAFLSAMMWHTGRRGKAQSESVDRGSPALTAMGADLYHSAAAPAGILSGSLAVADHSPRPESHGHHASAVPVSSKLLTPGTWLLIALVAMGLFAMARRFVLGLGATTHLDQQYPWGLWIAMDVGSGIALAGGGFVTAALVHIFHREHYHAVARSALLTALLGYTFYVPGLLADIGRWYNIWHPTIPSMWQGNSVLFEVGLCVMIYLNVQYAELAPIVCERFMGGQRRPRLAAIARKAHRGFEFILPALLVLGVTLSCFHQSSLGNLMVIAPYKLHALWWTPISPLLFLLSAMMVGFPMVIFTILFASWSLGRKPEMHVLAPLSRYVPVFLSIYLIVKVGDMVARGTYTTLADESLQSMAWIMEVAGGVVLPLLMLLRPTVRRSPRALAVACLMVILGVVLNRLNVFIIGYVPPYAQRPYFPSVTEFAVSIGLVAALLLAYRVAVTYLPILEPESKDAAA